MSQIQRYFHIRQASKPSKGGATVAVCPAKPDSEGRSRVRIKVAFCSLEDSFWRAMGRLNAKAHTGKTIPVERLPAELDAIHHRVYSMAHVPRNRREVPDYGYATKYFTPLAEEEQRAW